MQKMKNPSRGGNTAELERLEKELADSKELQQKQYLAMKEAQEDTGRKNKELFDAKASLKLAYEKIALLEGGAKVSETMITGYVRIATCPFKGIKPLPTKVDGVVVPRETDEDGVCYENIPVKTAIALMTDGSAFKRYLVGPEEVYHIEGIGSVGMFRKTFVFNKHRKLKNKDGYTFVEVELEAQKE